METFDQWYDRQPRVSLDRKSEHRLTWEACSSIPTPVRGYAIDYAPKGRRLLVRTESGNLRRALGCLSDHRRRGLASERSARRDTASCSRYRWREIGGYQRATVPNSPCRLKHSHRKDMKITGCARRSDKSVAWPLNSWTSIRTRPANRSLGACTPDCAWLEYPGGAGLQAAGCLTFPACSD